MDERVMYLGGWETRFQGRLRPLVALASRPPSGRRLAAPSSKVDLPGQERH